MPPKKNKRLSAESRSSVERGLAQVQRSELFNEAAVRTRDKSAERAERELARCGIVTMTPELAEAAARFPTFPEGPATDATVAMMLAAKRAGELGSKRA